MDHKKIGIVTPWFGMEIPGGAEAEIRGLALHLAQAGVKLEILTTCVKEFLSDWSVNYHKEGLTKEQGIPVRRFRVRKRDTAQFDQVNRKLMTGQMPLTKEEEETYVREMINSPGLYSYMEEHKEEYTVFVFIPYMFGTTYYGMQVCPEKSVLIPCLHDESYIYLEVFQELFSRIAGMIFHAQPEFELANRVYDLSNVHTEILGEGVNTELVYDAGRFREKYQIKDDFILYAGRKDEGKNVHTLLRYFTEYKKRNEDSLKLVLIGGGNIEIPKGAEEDVYDLGFVPVQDKYDAYGAATMLCQPSANESFSIVIMESWLCGRPVLVNADCAVTKNFVMEANGGLYFEDYFEFEGALHYIVNHLKTADSMGRQGQEYVRSHFSWDVIVKKYRRFLEGGFDVKCKKIKGGVETENKEAPYGRLCIDLKLQNHLSKEKFWEFLSQYALADADERAREELKNYLKEDFLRFCYTFSLLPKIDQPYEVFEIGGNPYYLTALMKKYTNYKITCSNFFNDKDTAFYQEKQLLVNADGTKSIPMPYVNLNIEKNWYKENRDVVCFCEVVEHMVESPVRALLNINKMLKVQGYLVMSTPNVNRLENVARMIAGANIYDPYSGYGQYGRHNREYNKHELAQMLSMCGFEIEVMFTSNVHEEYAGNYFDVEKVLSLVKEIPNRELDLGQYIFIRARKVKDVEKVEIPGWLYRSMGEKWIRQGDRIKTKL